MQLNMQLSDFKVNEVLRDIKLPSGKESFFVQYLTQDS